MTEPTRPGAACILLVDDDEHLRDAVRELLESFGYAVVTASSGKQALATLRERGDAIDLVVLDLAMPMLDGETTFYAIRDLRSDVRVLLATGYHLDDVVKRLTAERGVGFLPKPFRRAELENAVQGLLEERAEIPRADAAAEGAASLAELRKGYGELLPGKLDDLAGALGAARADAESRERAALLAHTLKGTSGSYGFSATSAALQEIENALRGAAEVDWDALDAALRRARSALPQAP